MATVIIMPKQGLLMEEGLITNWLVKEGETCTIDTPLFEMETDKLTITMDSTATGTLLKILHPEGDMVPITAPIAIVGEAGEDISGLLNDIADSDVIVEVSDAVSEAAPAASSETTLDTSSIRPMLNNGKILASPRAKLRAEENNIDIAMVSGSGADGLITEDDVFAYLATQPSATPLAKNVAKNLNIDLHNVTGSGFYGKITTADLSESPSQQPEAPTAFADASVSRGTRSVAMTGMRKAISKNMLVSKDTNAQTSHRMTIDMTAAIELRNQYKALDIKISYNDIIVRASAKALQDFPILNASVDGNNIIYHDYVNIGTAVSVPNGLIVPVIKDADIIGLTGIAAKSTELIGKARDGQLTDAEYRGGTFTVSSLGMFGLDDFVAIINPPEAAILAVGKIAKIPVVYTDENGVDQVVIRAHCTLCLSYDHRIIDGAEAAKFLKQLKTYLTNPILLI